MRVVFIHLNPVPSQLIAWQGGINFQTGKLPVKPLHGPGRLFHLSMSGPSPKQPSALDLPAFSLLSPSYSSQTAILGFVHFLLSPFGLLCFSSCVHRYHVVSHFVLMLLLSSSRAVCSPVGWPLFHSALPGTFIPWGCWMGEPELLSAAQRPQVQSSFVLPRLLHTGHPGTCCSPELQQWGAAGLLQGGRSGMVSGQSSSWQTVHEDVEPWTVGWAMQEAGRKMDRDGPGHFCS